MSAPFLWIILPLALAGLSLLIHRREPLLIFFGGGSALLLSLVALILPIDTALLIGGVSLKLAGSLNVLGRSFILQTSDGPLLVILYGLAAMWFFGAEAAGQARRLVPAGLAILSLLVASIAVQPFLFAAVLIEIAILLAVPMLLPMNQKPGPGLIRFVIYQTLAVPFILFAGWLLAGVETSPGDIELTLQSTAMLAMGLAFLLAIFPLYTWIPMLLEEASPYVAGFLLWILPQITVLFAMSFLDRYSFLRLSPELSGALRAAGLLMVVSAGLWAAFQRHLGRMLGYAVVAETGFTLIALGLGGAGGVQTALLQIIPRGLGLIVWAFSLTVLQSQASPPRFANIQGTVRLMPFAVAGVVLANLSVVGIPLLAGFPVRLALLEGLARASYGQTIWLGLGLLGLLTGAIRTLAVAVMAPAEIPWEIRESRSQATLISLGLLALILLGIFPQAFHFLIKDLPAMFQALGG